MQDITNLNPPTTVKDIEAAAKTISFTMSSDMLTGSLLRTLAATKPGGMFLEMGTGTGMGTAWILDGMDAHSKLITVDRDEQVVAVAKRYLGNDSRVTFRLTDAVAFIESQQTATFDFIFVDTYPGKFNHLDELLRLLKVGGLYVVDDLLSQKVEAGESRQARIASLIATLEQRVDLRMTKLDWSSGLIVATKTHV